jgi:hypothetical protein
MAKHDEKEEVVTLPASAITELINARVRDEVAKIFTAKTPDEQIAERMRELRGQNRPLPPEDIVPCRSPITGATFKMRVTMSRAFPAGRVAEMIDYVAPEGVDLPRDDGGLCDMPREKMFIQREDGEFTKDFTKPYLFWRYTNFWMKDWNELSGRPASFLAQWRTQAAA